MKKGDDSLILGTISGISAVALSCPLCIVASMAFFVNGVKEKLMGGLSGNNKRLNR